MSLCKMSAPAVEKLYLTFVATFKSFFSHKTRVCSTALGIYMLLYTMSPLIFALDAKEASLDFCIVSVSCSSKTSLIPQNSTVCWIMVIWFCIAHIRFEERVIIFRAKVAFIKNRCLPACMLVVLSCSNSQ